MNTILSSYANLDIKTLKLLPKSIENINSINQNLPNFIKVANALTETAIKKEITQTDKEIKVELIDFQDIIKELNSLIQNSTIEFYNRYLDEEKIKKLVKLDNIDELLNSMIILLDNNIKNLEKIEESVKKNTYIKNKYEELKLTNNDDIKKLDNENNDIEEIDNKEDKNFTDEILPLLQEVVEHNKKMDDEIKNSKKIQLVMFTLLISSIIGSYIF